MSGSSAALFGGILWALLALFVLRVAGQLVAATVAPAWLPPMRRWYSGLLAYRYLLPVQLLFIAIMAVLAWAVSTEADSLGDQAPRAGAWVVGASLVYAGAMVLRLVRWLTAAEERRGVFIPIPFHFVLAGFLFVYGTWLRR